MTTAALHGGRVSNRATESVATVQPPAIDRQPVTVWEVDAWHEQTEWEADAAYHRGFVDGVAWASDAVDAAISAAIGGSPGSWQDVVRRLVQSWDRPAARAEADR